MQAFEAVKDRLQPTEGMPIRHAYEIDIARSSVRTFESHKMSVLMEEGVEQRAARADAERARVLVESVKGGSLRALIACDRMLSEGSPQVQRP